MRIRASLLPMYPDCARREAVKAWPKLFGDYEKPRELDYGIAAHIGTGVHAAQQFHLSEFMLTSEYGPPESGREIAIETLREKASENGTSFDATTPHMNYAEKQTSAMVKSLQKHVLPKMNPTATEHALAVALPDNHNLTGTIDEVEKRGITDLKTGVIAAPASAQLGAYSLLERKHGGVVKRVARVFIKRSSVKKPTPIPTIFVADAKAAEKTALRVIAQIKKDLHRFDSENTIEVFGTNPKSMLCGEKYCPIFGTSMCDDWRWK